MLNDNAKKWVAALRSGEYKQGFGYLRSDEGFCCLGVACNIFNVRGWKNTKKGITYAEENQVLPHKVMDWLGLQDEEGTADFQGKTLTYLNDSGKSFSEIADVIESEPEGLFI